jgi:hypothetical protein
MRIPFCIPALAVVSHAPWIPPRRGHAVAGWSNRAGEGGGDELPRREGGGEEEVAGSSAGEEATNRR